MVKIPICSVLTNWQVYKKDNKLYLSSWTNKGVQVLKPVAIDSIEKDTHTHIYANTSQGKFSLTSTHIYRNYRYDYYMDLKQIINFF